MTLVRNQEAGQTKLHRVETSWRARHGPQTGTKKKWDEAITEDGEHIPKRPNAEEVKAKLQKVLRSLFQKHTAKPSDATKTGVETAKNQTP